MDIFSHILPSSPIIEVDCSLTSKQFSCLTNGPKYVPPCQSRFPHQTIDKIITREHDNIVKCFKKGLNNNYMSCSDQRAKEFFSAMENLLRQLYTTPLPPKLFARAQYEYRIVKSTQRQIKKSTAVIRSTDKSKVRHLGSAQDYHQKALQYMHETNAYREITSGINPCHDHIQKVLALIDPMLKNGDINLQLWKQYMRPNEKTTELAHLYFIPKPHKVNFRKNNLNICLFVLILILLSIDWYTIETACCSDKSSSNWCFTFLGSFTSSHLRSSNEKNNIYQWN